VGVPYSSIWLPQPDDAPELAAVVVLVAAVVREVVDWAAARPATARMRPIAKYISALVPG